MSSIKHYRELNVYQKAMTWVVNVFELTKRWPISRSGCCVVVLKYE